MSTKRTIRQTDGKTGNAPSRQRGELEAERQRTTQKQQERRRALLFLTANTLEGVEVYTSPAGTPGELWPEGSCGVVAFWTRWDPEGGSKWSWLKLLGGLAAFAVAVLLVR
jgi:hypothetical protein